MSDERRSDAPSRYRRPRRSLVAWTESAARWRGGRGDNRGVSLREIVLLGSTGSIGTQAIDIVRRYPDRFRIVGLGAGGANVAVLATQALELGVDVVGVAKASAVQDLQLAFYAEASRRGYATGEFRIPKILAGPQAMTELAQWPCDVVLNGVVGSLGLAPTLAALHAGRTLAAGQQGVADRRRPAGAGGVDAARSDRAGRLRALRAGPVPAFGRPPARSGGWCSPRAAAPFRGRRREELPDVTPEQALAHPTWNMGPVITINSATLVNKGLEVIEAHVLFGIAYDDIEVMVHPQSVIHSMVEFVDGSTHRPVQPARHAAADRAGAGLAGPGRRRGGGVGLDQGALVGVDPARRRGLPGASGWPRPRGGRAAADRPSSTPRTRSVCPDSSTAGCRSWASWTRWTGCSTRRPISPEPGTVDDVLAAESWARSRARRVDRRLGQAQVRELHGVNRDCRVRPRHPGLGLSARSRTHGDGEGLRHEGHSLLRRLRSDTLVVP